MNESIKSKDLILPFVFSICILIFVFFKEIAVNQTKIVFCNVGQGDAIYIRTREGIDVLIDSGPDQQVLNCLGKYLPFYDKTIEYIFLSHPQADHYGGLSKVIEHYQVNSIYMTTQDYRNDSQFLALVDKLRKKNIPLQYVYEGDKFNIGQLSSLTMLWPNKSFSLKSNASNKNVDINNLSLVAVFQEDNFRLLLTGDISSLILERLLQWSTSSYNILKIPHHGSKYGINKNILQLADPDTAVISVGKNNLHGHPAKEVINLLQALKIKTKRTDIDGDVVFLRK